MGPRRRHTPTVAELAAELAALTRKKKIETIIHKETIKFSNKIVCANIAIPLMKQFDKYDDFRPLVEVI